MKLVMIAAVAAATLAAVPASAAVLVNGGFETGDLTGWSSTGTTTYQAVTSGAGFGFSVSGAQDGTYYLQDGTYGTISTISQTFADTAGVTYTVSGWVSSDGAAPSNWSLAVNGTIFASASPAVFQDWVRYSTTFVGTGSDTLTIVSRNDPYTNGFDNFSVTAAAAVPEPAVWGLLIVGFGMTGVAARRRSAVLAA